MIYTYKKKLRLFTFVLKMSSFLLTSNGGSGIINLTFRDLFELLWIKRPLNSTNAQTRLYLWEFINNQWNVKRHRY